MSRENAKCPFCGTVNYNVNLEETKGWMECEKCKATVNTMPFARTIKVPCYTLEQLARKYTTSNSQ